MSFSGCTGIRKKYGGFEGLKGVDLTVEKAQAFAIIGPNGAGKTTLFKVLTGETPATPARWRLMERTSPRFPRTSGLASASAARSRSRASLAS